MNSEKITSLFNRIHNKMYAMGLSILKQSDDVDDAIQDAFFKIWNNRETIDENKNEESYAMTTLRNVCIDTLRKRGTKTESVSIPEMEAVEAENEDKDYDKVYDDVMHIIESELTVTQRKIITMRDVENRTYQEISAILNMEESTVRVNLSRARKICEENIFKQT